MSEQIEDQTITSMPLLVERQKLEWRITKNILMLLLCKLEEIPCTVSLTMNRDLEDWEGP